MLQVTPSAVAALEQARSAQEVPESYGVRISAQPAEDGQVAVAMGFAEQPEEGDQVTEESGTEVYVAPELAEPLAESVVDLQDTADGAQLVIMPQDEAESPQSE